MRHLASLFPATADKNLIAGLESPDDAAVYRMTEGRAIIQTTDFFTPIVDDPYTFGAIAAANALSDVYAMGGEILFALNVAGMPAELDTSILSAILEGGAAKVREAGALVVGGHTITNPELFYGLSVTGHVDPARLFTKGGIREGDHLFLSKPLGTGLVTTAQIVEAHALLSDRDLAAAVDSMLQLNAGMTRVARSHGVQAATDISGFGLLGHASEMLAAGNGTACAGLRIEAGLVPLLPNVQRYVERGVATRAGVSNRQHFGPQVTAGPAVDPCILKTLWEAETSGGLLLAIPAAQADSFSAACDAQDLGHWYIGAGISRPGIEIV